LQTPSHSNRCLKRWVVTRGDCRIQELASLVDPVEGVVNGTEFPGVARGSPGSKPMGSGRGRGHWAPYRAGVRSARECDVYPPVCRAGGEFRAISEKKAARSSNRGSPGPVDLAMQSSAFYLVQNHFTSASVPIVNQVEPRALRFKPSDDDYLPGNMHGSTLWRKSSGLPFASMK